LAQAQLIEGMTVTSIAGRRILRVVLAVSFFELAALPSGEAQEIRQVPQLTVGRLTDGERPVIDGRVSEAIWSNVPPFSAFIQQKPDEGQPATERTEIRFLLDRHNLYVGVINFDSEPDKLVVTESRRDADLEDTDSIQILQAGRLDDELPLAGVGEHLPGQVGGALGRVLNFLQHRTRHRFRRQLHQRETGVAEHGGQEVVKVMGDAAGQHAQALELLRVQHTGFQLTPLLFRPFALGDVHDGANHAGGLLRTILKQVALAPEDTDLAVRAHDSILHRTRGFVSLYERSDVAFDNGALVLQHSLTLYDRDGHFDAVPQIPGV
jgi:hypothetical protein